MTTKEYLDFMFDPENEFKCSKCPENRDADNWDAKYPCGQQNCWVTCHIKKTEHP